MESLAVSPPPPPPLEILYIEPRLERISMYEIKGREGEGRKGRKIIETDVTAAGNGRYFHWGRPRTRWERARLYVSANTVVGGARGRKLHIKVTSNRDGQVHRYTHSHPHCSPRPGASLRRTESFHDTPGNGYAHALCKSRDRVPLDRLNRVYVCVYTLLRERKQGWKRDRIGLDIDSWK